MSEPAAASAPTAPAGSATGPAPVPDAANGEYRWQLAAAILLSLATLCSAWCSFQAASWSSVYSSEARYATSARIEAVRHSDEASRQTSSDLLIFATWLEAEVGANPALADSVAERFLPHFRPAFDAWLATAPTATGGADLPPGSPFDQPEYRPPALADADAAYAQADAAGERADAAAGASNRYILTTVLYATVLFLAGIASKLAHPTISHAVVGLAGASLVGATGLLVTLPMQL